MKQFEVEVDELIEGFRCKQIVELADLRAVLYRFIHEGTGAELIHFSNER